VAEDINLNELEDLISGLGRELEPEKDDFGAIDPIVDNSAEDVLASSEDEQLPAVDDEVIEAVDNSVADVEHDAEWKEIEGFLEDFDHSFSDSSSDSDSDDFLDLTTFAADPKEDIESDIEPIPEVVPEPDIEPIPEVVPEPDIEPIPEVVPEPDIDSSSMGGAEEFEDDFLKELEDTEIVEDTTASEPDISVPDAMPVPDSGSDDFLPSSDSEIDDLVPDLGGSDNDELALDDLFSDSSDDNIDEIGNLLDETPEDAAPVIPNLDSSEFEVDSSGDSQEFDDLFDDSSVDDGLGLATSLDTSSVVSDIEDTGPLDLTDEDLNTIKRQIMFLTPKVQQLTRAAIVEQLLPDEQNNQLVRMLLAGKSSDEIKKFFEVTLNEDVDEPDDDLLDVVPQSLSSSPRAFSKALPILRVAVLLVGSVALIVGAFLLLVKPRIDAKKAYDLGLVQIRQGKYILAEKNFNSGESLLGKDLEWYNKYGIAYQKRKEYGRAIKKFRDGLKIKKNDFDTMLNISETYIYAGDYHQAKVNLKAILISYPNNANVLEKLGDLFIKFGDDKKDYKYYREAFGYYKKIIDDNWESLPGQFKVMLSYIKRDMYSETMTKLKHIRSIKKDAMNVPVLTELGRYYQTKKKFYESKKILKSVLMNDWEYHKAHFYLARYYRDQNDAKRALFHYKNAVKFYGESAKYHNELGETYLKFNDQKIPSAMRHFDLAIKYDAKFYKAYLNLGDLYFDKLSSADINLKNQQYKQALYYYQKVADLVPQNYVNRKYAYNFGWLYYRNGQVRKALQKWQRIYDKNPFHPAVSFVMGNAFLHLRKDELARTEYEKVIDYYSKIQKQIPRIDPGLKRHVRVIKRLSNAYNNLGIAFEMKKQRTKNSRWERKAILSFWKARALSEKINKVDYSYPLNNISCILHPNIKRGLSIAPELKSFSVPKTLYYEEQ